MSMKRQSRMEFVRRSYEFCIDFISLNRSKYESLLEQEFDVETLIKVVEIVERIPRIWIKWSTYAKVMVVQIFQETTCANDVPTPECATWQNNRPLLQERWRCGSTSLWHVAPPCGDTWHLLEEAWVDESSDDMWQEVVGADKADVHDMHNTLCGVYVTKNACK